MTKLAVRDADNAELWMQRGERIIRDLGFGAGYAAEEGRLACIGQAHQPGVRDQLEEQPEPEFLTFHAGVVRGVVRGWSRS